MIRRIAIAVLAVAFLGLAGILLLSWRPGIAPIERPASESFSVGSVPTEKLLLRIVNETIGATTVRKWLLQLARAFFGE